MEIRIATKEDLPEVLGLGKEFGHLMLYQTSREIMEKYLPRILVAEEDIRGVGGRGGAEGEESLCTGVVGYYHYIVSGDPGFEEMLRCYRQFPEDLVYEARQSHWRHPSGSQLCICMQGASHREIFREFILYLQERHPAIWCYCSIKSRRVDTYEGLGFTFAPKERFTFFNVSKGDLSTYQLGRWEWNS